MISEIKALLNSTSLSDIILGVILSSEGVYRELFTVEGKNHGARFDSIYKINLSAQGTIICNKEIFYITENIIYHIDEDFEVFYKENILYDDREN